METPQIFNNRHGQTVINLFSQRNIQSHHQKISILLLHLLRSSTESAVSVSRYMSEAVNQLKNNVRQVPDREDLVNYSKKIENECNILLTTIIPYHDTMLDITTGKLSTHLIRHLPSAWNSVTVQMKRLLEDFVSHKKLVKSLIEQYRDGVSKKQEENQKRIETNNFIVSLIHY